MKRMMSALLVIVMTGSAMAQPGAQPPTPPQPDPYAQPQPQPYPPAQPDPYAQPQPQPQSAMGPQYGYGQQPVMQYQLTLDEQYLLERGYISQGEHVGGAIVSLFFGFGLGQAVQGRWSEKGYIFTLGEGASMGLFIWGMVEGFGACFEGCSESREDRAVLLLGVGLVGLAVFRTWEIVDAFMGPASHNRKLRSLQFRLGMQPTYARVLPYVSTPKGDAGGAVAGLSLRF